MSKIIQFIKKYSGVLFALYMVLLVLVIVLKFPTGLVSGTIQSWKSGGEFHRMAPQLIPFQTIIEYVSQVHSLNDWFIKNLVCNIIMFMPYGFLFPFIMKGDKNIGVKVILSGCMVSVVIEIFQYVTALGQCDIDDVILNTVGVVLGYAIYRIIDIVIIKRSKEG